MWAFAKTFYLNHYCQILQELCPLQVLHLNDSLISFPEKKRTIFKWLFRRLLYSKVNVGNHRLLYVSRWNSSAVLLNLNIALRMLVIIMQLFVFNKITPNNINFASFHNIDCLIINNVCDSFCAETIHFSYFVESDPLELQRFCFQRSSCH